MIGRSGDTAQDHPEYDAFVERTFADPAVVGLLLTGSRAHPAQLISEHSDYDLELVTRDDAGGHWSRRRERILDVSVVRASDFVAGDRRELMLEERSAYGDARVLLDRLDGRIAEEGRQRARLSAAECAELTARVLDGYVNSTYRALKDARQGLDLGAVVDAADSVGQLRLLVFLLEDRLPPFPKYLSWELRHRPLANPAWQVDALTGLIRRVLADADPDALRSMFGSVEAAARARHHDDVLDSWGHDLDLLRP